MALPLLVAGALKSAYMLPAFLRHGSSPAAPQPPRPTHAFPELEGYSDCDVCVVGSEFCLSVRYWPRYPIIGA